MDSLHVEPHATRNDIDTVGIIVEPERHAVIAARHGNTISIDAVSHLIGEVGHIALDIHAIEHPCPISFQSLVGVGNERRRTIVDKHLALDRYRL